MKLEKGTKTIGRENSSLFIHVGSIFKKRIDLAATET
jgi:hypothetical protein